LVELSRPLLGERGPFVGRHGDPAVPPPLGEVLLQPRLHLEAELLGRGWIGEIHALRLPARTTRGKGATSRSEAGITTDRDNLGVSSARIARPPAGEVVSFAQFEKAFQPS
jgi:hypothetical protein